MGYGTFKFITGLSYAAIIILSLIAMFSSFGNIYNATFFKRNDTIIDKYNYENFTTSQTYLTDIQFGNYSSDYDLYGLTGELIQKCYLGSCYSKREQTSKDCSEACSISASICEVYNQKCINVICKKMDNGYDSNSACHLYNQIKYWRGEKMRLTNKKFYFALHDAVTETETCKEGYKQCGYLNKEKDKLCLRYNEACPINKIIIIKG